MSLKPALQVQVSRGELETDDDSERAKDRLGKLVKHKPVEKPE